jgi:hypothetical protein
MENTEILATLKNRIKTMSLPEKYRTLDKLEELVAELAIEIAAKRKVLRELAEKNS